MSSEAISELIDMFDNGAITLNTLIDTVMDDDNPMDFDELQLILEERDII